MVFALAEVLARLLAEYEPKELEDLLAIHGKMVRELVAVNRQILEHWLRTNGGDPRGPEPSES
jgi:hypothetical protein